MGLFDKTRYLKTLLFLAPLGLGLVFISIKSLTRDVSDLQVANGTIKDIYYTQTKFEFRNRQFISNVICIKLSNSEHEYITSITNNINLIDSILKKGDDIRIWVSDERKKFEIAQIEKDGVIIIPYDKASVVGWGFLIAGIITTFIAIGYLVKYPEDLLGKKVKG